MPKDTISLKIDGLVYGKILIRPKGAVFALADSRGMHISVTRKSEAAFHVEVSSDQPLKSVWDEARIGIAARGLGWRRSVRHANYLVNREYSMPPPFDPLHIVSFSRPDEPPIQKTRYVHLRSIELRPKGIWDELEVSLLFSGMDTASSYSVLPIGWTSFLFRVNKRNTEPSSSANLASLGD